MPIPKEYQPLITRLATKTAEGKVRWQPTQYGGFRVLVSGTAFDVWSGQDQQTEVDFVSFALADPGRPKRENIDSFSVDAGDDDFDKMLRLYADARRHALGIPARLSALEKALNSDDVIGDPPAKKPAGKFDDMEDDVPF
jgi:hypothetical protein